VGGKNENEIQILIEMFYSTRNLQYLELEKNVSKCKILMKYNLLIVNIWGRK